MPVPTQTPPPLAAFQDNDAAFSQLVEAYQARVFSFCFRLLAETTEAEDAAQETFLRAYQHRGRYDPNRPLGTWLLAIAAHHCIDRLRRRRLAWLGLDDPATLLHPALRDPAPGPEARVIQVERAHELGGQLARLAEKDREALVLHYWGYLSYAEIAAATGSTVTAVKSRLHRARARLGALLSQPPVRSHAARAVEVRYAA